MTKCGISPVYLRRVRRQRHAHGGKVEPDGHVRKPGRKWPRSNTPIPQAAVRAAHESGVTIVAGTDSFGTDVTPIGKEVRLLAEAGLSPLEALRSATVHAARLLGMGDDGGRLVRGGFADAIVVDADPLADASALEKVSVVVAQGAVVRNEL